MLLTMLLEAIVKILIFSLVFHYAYLAIVKISLRENSQDMLGGLVAQLFNDWLDVAAHNCTDRQYKLMLFIHLLPASLLTVFIWPYLLQTLLIINAVFFLLLMFSTTERS
jgi:hypothetical protein